MNLALAVKRTLMLGALLGVAVTLQACGSNTGMSSVKTPTLATQAVTRDIIFTPDNRIADNDAAALRGFLAGMNLQYGDRLTLDDPHAEGAAARRAAIAAIVAQSGGILSANAPPAGTDMPAGTARLWIERSRATPPACPDWSSNPYANMNGATHSNFGCAVNSNLAAMAADPKDLVEGRAYEGASGSSIAKDQDYWQRRVPTGFGKELVNPTTTTSGGGN